MRKKGVPVNDEHPFVIAVEGIDRWGELLAFPVGVVLATCTKDAWKQAIRRWPHHTLFEPAPWESIDPQIRLSALEQDRRM